MTYLLPVDLADFLGIDRGAESGDVEGGGPRTLHDVAMPTKGRFAKDPRLCISETTRDPLLIDESRYLDYIAQHADLELVGASLQVLSGGLGRLLVTFRRRFFLLFPFYSLLFIILFSFFFYIFCTPC